MMPVKYSTHNVSPVSLSSWCPDSVLGSGPGVRGRAELQLGEEMLRRGLSGQRQPAEVVLHPSVGH